jgi:hypothetical protein
VFAPSCCSGWASFRFGHIPAPDELSADIEALAKWREVVDKRVKDTSKARG